MFFTFHSEYYATCLTSPIGVSDPKIISDSQMTASSTYKEEIGGYQPEFGRLEGNRGDGWCSRTKDSNDDWLQIYFGDMFTVCGIDTQGDINGNEWVTAFKLSFSTDGSSWITYTYDNGTDVVRHSYNYFSVVGIFSFSLARTQNHLLAYIRYDRISFCFMRCIIM